MTHYLTPDEISQVRIDYKQLLASPESTEISIKFRKYLTGGSSTDPIYGNTEGRVHPDIQVVEDVQCVVNYVDRRNVKLLEFDYIEVGDAVFETIEKL